MDLHHQYDAQPNVVQDAHAALMNDVIKKAYLLVGASLIPTVIGALFGMANIATIFGFMAKNPLLYLGVVLGGFYGLCYAIEKNRYTTTGVVLMFTFTFFMGVLLAPLLAVALQSSNGGTMIMVAAGGTGALFLALSALGSDTSKDFSFLGKFVGVSVIIFMATMILNYIFLKMPTLNILLSAIIIPLSGAIIVYRINMAARGGETSPVSLALDIYIGLYNIFSALLRLLIIFSGRE